MASLPLSMVRTIFSRSLSAQLRQTTIPLMATTATITTPISRREIGVVIVAVILIGLGALAISYTSLPDLSVALLMGNIAVFFFAVTLMMTNRHVKSFGLKMAGKFHAPGIRDMISGLYDTFGKYKHHKGLFLYSIWISFGIQAMNIAVYILLANALDISVPWGYYFLFFPIVTVITMLPISLNGLGIREGMFIYLFSTLGVPSAEALSLSLSWIFIVTCISLLGGVIFAIRKGV